jgi:hypothetical protein
MIIELILIVGFGFATLGGVGFAIRNGITSRRFHVDPNLEAPEPRRMVLGPPQQLMIEAARAEIPEDIRRELDKTPEEAWNEQFHLLLDSSPSREVKAVLSHYPYGGGEPSEHTALEDCTCKDCTEA